MSLTDKIRSSKGLRSSLVGAIMAGAVYGLPLETARAEPQREAQVQYKTVDDILGDLFEPISTESYEDAVESAENVVVLFYDTEGVGTPTEHLAEVFRKMADKYADDIRFFKFEDDSDPDLLYNNHQGLLDKFSVSAIPSYQLFKNGQKVFTNEGGPGTAGQIADYSKGTDKNLKYLISLK